MNLKSILSTVGTLTGFVNPAVSAAIIAVNKFLPDNEKLSRHDTGDTVMQEYDALGLEDQASVDRDLAHKLGMEKEHTSQLTAAYAHDNSGKSTRPMIAEGSFYMVCLITIAFLFQGFGNQHQFTWQEMVAMAAPFVTWAGVYMNVRKTEKIARYNTSVGHPAMGLISGVIGAFKK